MLGWLLSFGIALAILFGVVLAIYFFICLENQEKWAQTMLLIIVLTFIVALITCAVHGICFVE